MLDVLPPAEKSAGAAGQPGGGGAGAEAGPPPGVTQETVDRMQAVTRALAFEPDAWTTERAEEIRTFFDDLAPDWHLRNQPERLVPLQDALARGGVAAGGVCVEVGSGTGFQTPTLARHFDLVVSVDLSAEMLARAPRPAGVSLIQADASLLPLHSESVDAVVCVNAFLFPAEYRRVLRGGGAVVFVSTRGDHTPIYLPPAEVARALGARDGVTSEAGAGTWTTVKK